MATSPLASTLQKKLRCSDQTDNVADSRALTMPILRPTDSWSTILVLSHPAAVSVLPLERVFSRLPSQSSPLTPFLLFRQLQIDHFQFYISSPLGLCRI